MHQALPAIRAADFCRRILVPGNTSDRRLLKSDVKYRFVIDMASIKRESVSLCTLRRTGIFWSSASLWVSSICKLRVAHLKNSATAV